MITLEQANLAADLARTIRPAWDTRAITDQLAKVRDKDLREAVWALLTVAANPAMRTPKAITFEGDHWPRITPTVPKHPHYARGEARPLTDNGRQAIEEARARATEAKLAWDRRAAEEAS